jgi:hypothetical protein
MPRLRRFHGIALAILLTFTQLGRATVASFDDIQFWAGAGATATNRAAIVIQWNLGSGPDYTPTSLVWGYGWNSGSPTGWDALTAIVAEDPRLALEEHPSFEAVFGMFYDAVNDGSGFDPGIPDDLGGPEDGHANNPVNPYQEGWFSGFWNYYVFAGSFDYDIYGGPPDYEYLGTGHYDVAGSPNYSNVSWFAAPIGAASRDLVNGAWDAWSFAPGFEDQSIATPTAAVPEPSIVALLVLGLGLLLWRRKHA